MFFGLPFFKPEDIEDCFTNNLVSILPKDEKSRKVNSMSLYSNYIYSP